MLLLTIYTAPWGPFTPQLLWVQQGDPLGPLCFALTLQPVIQRINEDVPNLLCNAWYLDDGTLCGTPQDLAAALRIIEEEGPLRGLHVNGSKSLLYIPPGDDPHQNKLPPDIPISSSGFLPPWCPSWFRLILRANVTRYEKKGHPAKIPNMPFSVPFASAEFCAHSHIFVLFMRQSAETQWPPIFRHPGNSEFENGSNEMFRIRCPFTFTQ